MMPNFFGRWNRLKGYFSRNMEKSERVSASRKSRWERGIWQAPVPGVSVTPSKDFNRHVDTIHWNPVKHSWVNKIFDWPYSSFHHYLEQGIYTENRGNNECHDIDRIE